VSEDIVKELTLTAFDFIWQGKPDKVKRTMVIADYDEGGIKMLDVESFVHAQKVMWVKRLITNNNEGSWKIYPTMLLGKLLDKHSFQCNTTIKALKKLMPDFYVQLFEAWGKMKELPDGDPYKLRREILWLNNNIKIGRKEACYKEWYRNGIVMFHDLLKEDGTFKSPEELEVEFNVEIKALEYISLISAIPQQWKRDVRQMKIPKHAISNQEQLFMNCRNRLMALGIISNRDVYWELVTKKKTKPICVMKWCDRYHIEDEDWKGVFKKYASIIDTRMKAFQFKILNNIIPCNLYLKRIGRSDTDKCPTCNELEDLSHYMVYCQDTGEIWKQLSRWWQGITNQNVTLTEPDIMIGLQKRPEKLRMHEQLDDIILAVKWKIYANKQQGQGTCLYQVLCAIENMIRIEKLIAARRCKSNLHEEKWGIIEDYLT
jgi:hypothetical protein